MTIMRTAKIQGMARNLRQEMFAGGQRFRAVLAIPTIPKLFHCVLSLGGAFSTSVHMIARCPQTVKGLNYA